MDITCHVERAVATLLAYLLHLLLFGAAARGMTRYYEQVGVAEWMGGATIGVDCVRRRQLYRQGVGAAAITAPGLTPR